MQCIVLYEAPSSVKTGLTICKARDSNFYDIFSIGFYYELVSRQAHLSYSDLYEEKLCTGCLRFIFVPLQKKQFCTMKPTRWMREVWKVNVISMFRLITSLTNSLGLC